MVSKKDMWLKGMKIYVVSKYEGNKKLSIDEQLLATYFYKGCKLIRKSVLFWIVDLAMPTIIWYHNFCAIGCKLRRNI